jgi:hypothetical protein
VQRSSYRLGEGGQWAKVCDCLARGNAHALEQLRNRFITAPVDRAATEKKSSRNIHRLRRTTAFLCRELMREQ